MNPQPTTVMAKSRQQIRKSCQSRLSSHVGNFCPLLGEPSFVQFRKDFALLSSPLPFSTLNCTAGTDSVNAATREKFVKPKCLANSFPPTANACKYRISCMAGGYHKRMKNTGRIRIGFGRSDNELCKFEPRKRVTTRKITTASRI